MKNQILKKTALTLILSFSLSACVSKPKGPQTIELKNPTDVSNTAYRSASHTEEFYENQVIREKSEGVDFIVQTKPAENAQDDRVQLVMSTVGKNGSLSLNDFGFPELKESIDFQYTPQGKVLKAGHFNELSLFFVPPLPLPTQPVEEGDTWEVNHIWVSQSGLELLLNVIGIHKGYKSCGDSSPCLNMEISGTVKPASDRIVGMDLNSRISGHLLFSIPKGEVVSSEVRSQETIELPDRKIVSRSCMISKPTPHTDLKKVSLPKCEVAKN